jgi:hypothetical protein
VYEKAKTEEKSLYNLDLKLARVWKDIWCIIEKDIQDKLEHEMQSLLCL